MDIRKLTWAIDIGGRSESGKAIIETDKKVDNLKDTMQGTTGKIDETSNAVDKMGDNMKKTTKSGGGLNDLSKGLDDLGKKMGKKGKDLTKKVTLPLVAVGGTGLKMAMDLEDATNKMSTLVDTNVVSMSEMEKGVREISDASGIAQTEIAEAVYDSLSAGVDTANALEFVRSGIDLTRAGFTDMGVAIDATTTVMNAYEDGLYEASQIHDIFVQTQDKGKISVDELGSSIGRVIPNASSLGVGLENLGASYAILTAKGQNAQLATTNLNAMLGELGKTGSDTDEILRSKTGKSFSQLMDDGMNLGEVLGILEGHAEGAGLSIKDLFGSTSAGAAAVTLLSDGVEGYNKSLQDMHDAEGKTAENAEKTAGKSRELATALNQAKNALTDLGVIMAPIVTTVSLGITKAVDMFNNLDDSTKNIIVHAGALAAATGPVLSVGEKLFTGASKLIEVGRTVGGVLVKGVGLIKGVVAVLGGPLTLAIVGAVAVGVLLYKNWDTVKEKASDLGAKISETWDNVKTKTTEAWDNIKSKVTSALDTISKKWEATKEFFKNPIKGTVDLAQRGAGWVKDKFTGNSGQVPRQAVDGSNAGGVNFIGKDGSVRKLHRREMVLTGDTADDYRSLGGTKDSLPSMPRVSSSKGAERIDFSPVIHVTVEGNADKETAVNIGEEVRKQLDLYFRKLNLQRG